MMKKRVIVATIILINSIISLYPQQTENYLEIRGRAELDMQPLNGAVITLYEGNTKINSVKTGSDGIFSFKLEINKYYVVEVGKDKYISKRLAFDTSLPEEEKGVWVREFAMSVVKSCDGVNYSALTDPVDVIKYNAKRKDFESDNAHLSKMRSKLEGIMMDNEQCLEDKYDKLIKEADRAMANKQFDEAREKYAAASEIFPDKEYPKQKSSQITQQISKLENIENLYTKTIGEADALLAQNKTDEALLKFKAASILKPQESYPKQKAGEIEQLIAKAQANQQVASAQEAKYNNTIARANAEMTAKNFEAAKQLYQQALQVKPGDQLAQAKIAEAERAAVSHQQQVADRNKQTETENEYQQVLAQADNLFKNKDYKAALEQFNKALSLKPNEAYPKQRVNQLNSSIAAEEAGKQREINAGYQNAMTAAEKSSSAKDFQSAKNYYQQALQFKPDDAALRSKLAEMDRLMAQDAQNKQQQEETRRQYLALVQKADQLYAAKNLESAKEAYQEAGSRKPDEQYPLQRIQEIDRQIFADKAKEQQKIQENYQNAVNTGNTLLTQKQHQRAKEAFQQALAIKPGDVFAQNKINETDNLLRQEQAQQTALQAKKTQYDGIITNADKFFASKDFTAAKSEYLKATQVLPDEQYPKQRVQEIDRLSTLAEAEKQRELEAKFMAAFNTGNNYMTQKSYTNAISSFEEALTYKPGDINVKNRLAEANNLSRQEQAQQTALQAKKTQYDGIISNADKFFASKDFTSAKSEYLKATQVLPDEQYPKQRVQEIDRLIADDARAKRETEAGYQGAINSANTHYTRKSYENAKASYQEALGYKPDDILAKNRILEIDNILKQQMADQAALQAKQKQYDDLVARADGLFNQKNYPVAKEQYQNAIQVMSNQPYPQQKIAEIDRLLAEEQKLLADNQAKENAYNQAIRSADGLFSSKQYEQAKAGYNNALALKPAEAYPKTRITEIDRLILQQQQTLTKETNYKNEVTEADRLFAEKKYPESKASYNKALGLMPSEQYPKSQIAKIDNLLAEAGKIKQQELANQKQYDNLIAQADKLFTASNYPQAKEIYQQALAIKPDEQYPRARIARIDEIYAMVAQQQKKQGTTTTTSAQGQSATAKKIVPAELKFKNDSERDIYLAGLKREYPDGVTLEVYKEKFKVTSRYVIIRGNEVNELREIYFSNYGGREYSLNGKPITQMYFDSQVKPRDGEKFVKFEY